jgi:hypothetical protein
MHKHAKALIVNYREFSPSIQPWQFGHSETKRTCFWLKNLPLLKPTDIVPGREQRVFPAGNPPASRNCFCRLLVVKCRYLPELSVDPADCRSVANAMLATFETSRGCPLCADSPVWYIDITPGHDFLTKSVDKMIDAAQSKGNFRDSPMARICPFIEQMGTGVRVSDGRNYQKEFWWEREWRHVGDFRFRESDIAFGFAPEAYIEEFEDFMHRPKRRSVRFVDSTWSTERMIAHLARYRGILSPFDPEPEP